MSLCEHMKTFARYYFEGPVQVMSRVALGLACTECDAEVGFDEWAVFAASLHSRSEGAEKELFECPYCGVARPLDKFDETSDCCTGCANADEKGTVA